MTVLAPNEIHLWLASTLRPEVDWGGRPVGLSAEEEERASRFHFEPDRIRFVAAHQVLRRVLSRYLDSPPDSLQFAASDYGKPHLIASPSHVQFNLSHSGNFCLVAVTCARRVGVDIERVRPELADTHVAEHFFAPAEATALRSLPQAEQAAAFYRCWTRKEAFIKARGEGLSLPLVGFTVALGEGESNALRSTLDDPEEAGRWTLLGLPAPSGYQAALAYEGHECKILQFEAG